MRSFFISSFHYKVFLNCLKPKSCVLRTQNFNSKMNIGRTSWVVEQLSSSPDNNAHHQPRLSDGWFGCGRYILGSFTHMITLTMSISLFDLDYFLFNLKFKSFQLLRPFVLLISQPWLKCKLKLCYIMRLGWLYVLFIKLCPAMKREWRRKIYPISFGAPENMRKLNNEYQVNLTIEDLG